tara:strand:+ start:24472 stop:25401 length:930 start_codon:yes stop_codon:yes gene_type:complete
VSNSSLVDLKSGDFSQFLRTPELHLVGLEFSGWCFDKPFAVSCTDTKRAFFYLVKRGAAWFRTGPGIEELHYVPAGTTVGVEGHVHQWMDSSHIHASDIRKRAGGSTSTGDLPVEIAISSIDRSAAVLQRLPNGAIVVPADAAPYSSIMRGCIDMIDTELAQPSPSTAVTRRLAEIIMLQLIGYARSRLLGDDLFYQGIAHDEFLLRAMTAFFANPAAPWTVASLAEEAGLSRAAFSDRFTRVFSEPPMRVINRLRILRAGEMLTQSNASLGDISQANGYGSAPAFLRAFSRQFGCTPGEWRKRSRGRD